MEQQPVLAQMADSDYGNTQTIRHRLLANPKERGPTFGLPAPAPHLRERGQRS